MKKKWIIILAIVVLIIALLVVTALMSNKECRTEGESCTTSNLCCSDQNCVKTNLPDEGGCISIDTFPCSSDSDCFTGYKCVDGKCLLK